MSITIEVSTDVVGKAKIKDVSSFSARQIYDKQYYLEHKDAASAYKKQYYDEHKDAISAYSRQYYTKNKDRVKAYGAVHHVKYYADNKEEICARTRRYYRDNVDIITEKKCAKFECACGGRYTTTNKAQHEKTNMHISSLERA